MNHDGLEGVVKQAKARGIDKETFKRQVVGQSNNRNTMRGKTNAARHDAAKKLEALIDFLWDEARPAEEAVKQVRAEVQSLWQTLVLYVSATVLVVALAAYILVGS